MSTYSFNIIPNSCNADLFNVSNINNAFFENNISNICWICICEHQDLSEEFMEKFQDHISWKNVSIFQTLKEPFMYKFKHKLIWKHIWENQHLSDTFILDFKKNVFWENILRNKHRQYYSITLIKQFKPKLNRYYTFYRCSKIIQQWWKNILYKPLGIGYEKSKSNFKHILKINTNREYSKEY